VIAELEKSEEVIVFSSKVGLGRPRGQVSSDKLKTLVELPILISLFFSALFILFMLAHEWPLNCGKELNEKSAKVPGPSPHSEKIDN